MANHAPERILVQDDEELMRELLGVLLTTAGHKCQAVQTPKETLQVLKSQKNIDLIICGILEWSDESYQRFHQLIKMCPEIPVVVCTAVHDLATLQNALRMGAI